VLGRADALVEAVVDGGVVGGEGGEGGSVEEGLVAAEEGEGEGEYWEGGMLVLVFFVVRLTVRFY